MGSQSTDAIRGCELATVTRSLKGLALALAAAGIVVLSIVATASIGSPWLSFALAAAIVVVLLPLMAFFIVRRGRLRIASPVLARLVCARVPG